MVKAYLYTRVSSTRQLFSSGLQRQRRRAEEFARLHSLEIDETFDQRDAGVSAYTGEHIDRGTLGRFLASIREKGIERGSYLLIESLDRLSRLHPREALGDFLEILASGVSIAVLSENRIFHPGGPDSQELLELVRGMARAHDESRLRSERTSSGWELKLSKIDRMILTSRAPGWLAPRPDRSTFDLIEERALIVRSIFDLAQKEGLGAEAIASELNRRRIKPFSGSTNGWRKSSIHSILKNRAVIGEFQPHVVRGGIRRPVGDAKKGYFPAVIGETEFNAVQSLRGQRRVGSGGRIGSGAVRF